MKNTNIGSLENTNIGSVKNTDIHIHAVVGVFHQQHSLHPNPIPL
ncbi:hypothetical protein [Gelidibacter salicanalis]|nr:hypothetical protein [Gelidibacter salicanalis]